MIIDVSSILLNDLCNWNDMKYRIFVNNNNYYVLFGRKNQGILLVVLYFNVDIKPFIEKGEVTHICPNSIFTLALMTCPRVIGLAKYTDEITFYLVFF